MKKVIIFDVMGVIFKIGDDTNDLLVPYIQGKKPEMSRAYIVEKYMQASLGEISPELFWKSMGFMAEEASSVEKYYLDNYLTLDNEFLQCLNILSKKYRIVLLSNDISEWSSYLRKKYGIEPYIEQAFISSDLGLRKPDPAIYTHVLQELQVEAYECIFIDDSSARVEAADKLGIAGIVFNRDDCVYQGLQIRSFSELTGLL